jgi:hydrogenase nickel incorporation protein HypA/HybF
MHEYSIVSALVDRVEREVRSHGGERVHRIEVRIGALSGVEISLLETAFETFREGTICDGAEMKVVAVPAEWGCSACGAPVPDGGALRCSVCDAPAKLVRGDEIFLDRIEMEVPDPPKPEAGSAAGRA